MEIRIDCLEHIGEAARTFIAGMGAHRVFAFYGQMGAGKTTFIKAVCEELGVGEQVTSPTFAIVNVYEAHPSPLNAHPTPIYHFDFYRIKRMEEAFDIGCEEYFYSGSLCFIEWPELIEPILPPGAVRVEMARLPDGTRLVSMS